MSWLKKHASSTIDDAAPASAPPSIRTWTKEQTDIFTAVTETTDNLVVIARAGTGKTTTIIEAAKRWNATSDKHTLIAAFNKRIADELVSRLEGTTIHAKTLHALGFMMVRREWARVTVEKSSLPESRAVKLAKQADPSAPQGIVRKIATLHTKTREVMPLATTVEDLLAVAERFEIEPGDYWESQGFDVDYLAEKALQCLDLACVPSSTIDYADMVYLPVRLGWTMPLYDLLIVDEAQDMSPAQLQLVKAVANPDARFMIVGDDRQAIYGFRGADITSLTRLQRELNAVAYGLKTTFRCGKAIVDEAHRWVSDVIAAPQNPDGVVSTVPYVVAINDFAYGDFVLSRTNAPLASVAMRLVRENRRVRIAGRDFGEGLMRLVQDLSRHGDTIDDFLNALHAWYDRESRRLRMLGWDEKLAIVADRYNTLCTIAATETSLRTVNERINMLFSDNGVGDADRIVCSTVHKAKGLEANRVWALESTFRFFGSQEEQNICYVAVTRAKQQFTWVMS